MLNQQNILINMYQLNMVQYLENVYLHLMHKLVYMFDWQKDNNNNNNKL